MCYSQYWFSSSKKVCSIVRFSLWGCQMLIVYRNDMGLLFGQLIFIIILVMSWCVVIFWETWLYMDDDYGVHCRTCLHASHILCSPALLVTNLLECVSRILLSLGLRSWTMFYWPFPFSVAFYIMLIYLWKKYDACWMQCTYGEPCQIIWCLLGVLCNVGTFALVT